MRYLRGIWNILFLAAGVRFGYVLYTEPAARVTTKEWFIWLATGGLFREGSASEIIQNAILLLGIVAFFDAVRSTLISLSRWFTRTTRRLRCPSCDRIIKPADNFCANCGSRIRGTGPEQSQTVAIAKPTRQTHVSAAAPADIDIKSRNSMVAVAWILILVSMFSLFWLVNRHGPGP